MNKIFTLCNDRQNRPTINCSNMEMHNNENKTFEKIFNLKSCIVILLLLFGVNAWGQITTINYSFEGSDKNRWTFVNGSATNKWCISKAAAAQNGGTYSLYVTNGTGGKQPDTEQTYGYSNGSASTVWAYIDIYFPESSTDYTFSFDWKCYGESTYDYFSVYLGSTTSSVTAGSLTQPTNSVAMINNLRTSNPTYFNDYNGNGYITSSASNVPWVHSLPHCQPLHILVRPKDSSLYGETMVVRVAIPLPLIT